MRSQGKYDCDHPILDILSVFTTQITVDTQSQLLQDFYSTWDLPILTKHDIAHISESLKSAANQTDPLANLAKKFKFSSTVRSG